MAHILVCGTLAYDLIGRFGSVLGPDTRNVKLDRLDEGFGGCAMNVAYNLQRLGHTPVPLVYAGDDYEPAYGNHVRRNGISEAGILRAPGTRCARGIVLTACDGAQFTAFYPGPSGLDRVRSDVAALIERHGFDAAIIAPDLPEKSLACAHALAQVRLKIWCPGQYAEHIGAEYLEPLLRAVDLVVANRHEWRSLRARLPVGHDAWLPGLIVTQGPRPVLAPAHRIRVAVPAIPEQERIDPTGCGDAFVAALAGALAEGGPLADAVRAGIELAGRCLRSTGAQGH